LILSRQTLGLVKIKIRDEKLEEVFRAWLVSRALAPEQAQYLSLLKNRGIATGRVHIDDLFKPPLSIVNAAGIGIELFGEKGLQEIVEDLNRHVFSITA
jgi:type I restriction enzyme, R subunit